MFDFQDGSESFLRHKRVFKERGDPICVYSFATMKDGSQSFDLMSMDEVGHIRLRSKAKDSGTRKSDYSEMSKKTVFRRHSKWLPMSYEMRNVIEKDDDASGYMPPAGFENAKPVEDTEEETVANPTVAAFKDLYDNEIQDKEGFTQQSINDGLIDEGEGVFQMLEGNMEVILKKPEGVLAAFGAKEEK